MMRFWDYLRYRRRMLLAAAVCCVIFAASFALYRLPLRAVLYPVGLCLLVGLGFAVWDYRRTLKRHRALTGCGDLTAELLRELPPPESLAEEDYRAQLLHLRQLCTELQSAADNRYRDAIEYYTTWAHQIKTPIASMRLALQGEDTALFRRLLSDLSRTEQYVEMVMAFLRLEDAPGDYVFREVALDEVLRQALRRFSAEFIDRRLRLDYTPTGLTVLTDEKWLCFVLEQLLSNALKYTREGVSRWNWPGSGFWRSGIPASALRRRTCREFLKRGIPGRTAGRTSGPAGWGCTCAAASAATWG